MTGSLLIRRPLLAMASLAVFLAAMATFAATGTAAAGEAALRCTNPISGANWQIRIDFERSTVDSNPARITDTEISWHDAKDGGNYTLDRKTGSLTFVAASSTGGYFLHDLCRSESSD